MAFKTIPLEATGSFQTFNLREIEFPLVIDLSDTPTSDLPNGLPQTETFVEGGFLYSTGSAQSIIFDGVDDWIWLPGADSSVCGSHIILEGLGAAEEEFGKPPHGASATNISIDCWVKVDEGLQGFALSTKPQKTTQFAEFSVARRDTTGVNDYGIDGRYTGRIIYTDDPQEAPGTSAHFVEFIYASSDDVAWSLTSNNSLESTQSTWLGKLMNGVTGWNHITMVYQGGTAPNNNGDYTTFPDDTNMKIYINGTKDREMSIQNLENQYEPNSPFPSVREPFDYFEIKEDKGFAGRIDEMRLMTATGDDTVYGKMATLTNIGKPFNVFDEDLHPDILAAFTPTANHVIGYWQFESTSAIDLVSHTPLSILDSSVYGHHGTPEYFEGTINYSKDIAVTMGLSASGALQSLSGGVVDHGGQFMIKPEDDRVIIDHGIKNLILPDENVWSVTGADVDIKPEEKNIYYGSSAVRVQTRSPHTGARHTMFNDFLYHENDYSVHMKILHLSGSNSAKISFTLGETTNTFSTTAVMKRGIWEPVYLTHKYSDPTGLLKTLTVDVTSLEDQTNQSLVLIDGLAIWQGRDPVLFTGPSTTRYSGQINWAIRD